MEKLTDKDIGVKIVGTVINSTLDERHGTSKKGDPYTIRQVKTTLLCGSEVVYIQQRIEEGQAIPRVPQHGEIVSVKLEPRWDDNGVLVLNGKLQAA